MKTVWSSEPLGEFSLIETAPSAAVGFSLKLLRLIVIMEFYERLPSDTVTVKVNEVVDS